MFGKSKKVNPASQELLIHKGMRMNRHRRKMLMDKYKAAGLELVHADVLFVVAGLMRLWP